MLPIEIEAYPGPKKLFLSEVSRLLDRFGSSTKVAEFLGVSILFVLQNNLRSKRYKRSKRKISP